MLQNIFVTLFPAYCFCECVFVIVLINIRRSPAAVDLFVGVGDIVENVVDVIDGFGQIDGMIACFYFVLGRIANQNMIG